MKAYASFVCFCAFVLSFCVLLFRPLCFLAPFEAKLRMEHTDHEQQLKDEEAMELGLQMLKYIVLKK